jgi:hypothetical protein
MAHVIFRAKRALAAWNSVVEMIYAEYAPGATIIV